MAIAANLIGMRFGKLTVIQRAENNHRGNTMWLCKCDCGGEKIALGYDLTHGRTMSCGCFKYMKGKQSPNKRDLIGKRFGRLRVLDELPERGKNYSIKYLCRCDCGKFSIVSASNLRSGHAKSCGCYARERARNTAYDLTGKRFERLVVVRKDHEGKRGRYWFCQCDCGNTKIACGHDLMSGRTKSCGCFHADNAKLPKKITHGDTKTRIYREWSAMKRRCSPSYHGHHIYFDRNIRVCTEWEQYEPFKQWAFAHGYSDDLTLDRIDNDKGYCPENCRWITNKEQQNNRRNNRYVTFGGETKTLKQWSELQNIDYGTVKGRLRCGWSELRALGLAQ